MKTKKLIVMLITFAMLLNICSASVFASENAGSSPSEPLSYADMEFIRDSEYSRDSSGSFIFTRTNAHSDSGNMFFSKNASPVKNVQEQMVIRPLNPEDGVRIAEEIDVLRAGGGTREEYIEDVVIVYLEVEYKTSNGAYGDELIEITYVSGSYEYRSNNRATVTDQVVFVEQNGYGDVGYINDQDVRLDPWDDNWSYPIRLGWEPVYTTSICEVTYEVEYIYGSSQGGYEDIIELYIDLN